MGIIHASRSKDPNDLGFQGVIVVNIFKNEELESMIKLRVSQHNFVIFTVSISE